MPTHVGTVSCRCHCVCTILMVLATEYMHTGERHGTPCGQPFTCFCECGPLWERNIFKTEQPKAQTSAAVNLSESSSSIGRVVQRHPRKTVPTPQLDTELKGYRAWCHLAVGLNSSIQLLQANVSLITLSHSSI